MLKYEKDISEFVNKYNLTKQVAQEICASHTNEEVKTVLDFLNNYGSLLKIN